MPRWTLAAALLAGAAPADAIEKCAARIDPRDGTILVFARDVQGGPDSLLFGDAPGAETTPFANAADCVKGARARKCALGAPGSAERMRPPESCKLALADANLGSCEAYVRGCVPGVRSETKAAVVRLGSSDGPLLAPTTRHTLSWVESGLLEFDSDDLFDPNSDQRIAPARPGYYRASAGVQWGAGASGRRDLFIVRNVSETTGYDTLVGLNPQASTGVVLNGSVLLRIEEDDFVTVEVSHSNPDPLQIFPKYFELEWVGPLEEETP